MISKQKADNEQNQYNLNGQTSAFMIINNNVKNYIDSKNENDKSSSKQLISTSINFTSNDINSKKYFLKTEASKKKKRFRKKKKHSSKKFKIKKLSEISNEEVENSNKNKRVLNPLLFKSFSNSPNLKSNNIENFNAQLSLIREAEVSECTNNSISNNNSETDINTKEIINNNLNKNITIKTRNKKSKKNLLNSTTERFSSTKKIPNDNNQKVPSAKEKNLEKNLLKTYSTRKSSKKHLKRGSYTNSKENINNNSSNEVKSMNGTQSNYIINKYIISQTKKKNNDEKIKNENVSIDKLSSLINIRCLKNPITKNNYINNKKCTEEIKTNNNNSNPNNNNNDENETTLKKNRLSTSVNGLNSKKVDTPKNNNNNTTKNDSIKAWINNKKKSYNMTMRQKKEDFAQRMIRIRKAYQEKDFHQSMQNMKTHFYLIFPGNASYLIKNCMCHRVNWKEPFSTVSSLYNFRWQQLSYGFDYNSLGQLINNKQIINHFENHYCISNKANMFINLMDYCEKRKISVFKYVPFTIIYKIKDKNNKIEENKNLENLKTFIENASRYVKEYKDIGKYFEYSTFKNDHEKREEFQNNICNKIKEKMKKESSYDLKKIIEELPPLISDYKMYSDYFPGLEEYDKIQKYIKNNENQYVKEIDKNPEIKFNLIGKSTSIEIPNSHYCKQNMWVIKAVNLNRGMCIRVVNSFDQLKKIIEKFKEGVDYGFTEENIEQQLIANSQTVTENKNNNNNNNQDNNNNQEEEKNNSPQKEKMYYCNKIIIQKYIESPLLYKGRKCDMRIWVLITHNMKVYVFKEGHLKTCSVKFDINSTDAYTHITNYSFQKYNNNFEKFEKGNEVPFSDFQKFIDENYSNKNYKLKIDLMKNIKEIITLTMRSARFKINKNNRNYQFEIFGYDFMLDNDFNLFLIEINTNPGLEESSPWIKVIVPRMLDDALRLTIDQVFETDYDFSLNYKTEDKAFDDFLTNIIKGGKNDTELKNNKNKKYISPFPVPGYSLDENLWDFVCDLNGDDPLDTFLDKKEDNKNVVQSYTGIRHLLGKKNRCRDKSFTNKIKTDSQDKEIKANQSENNILESKENNK